MIPLRKKKIGVSTFLKHMKRIEAGVCIKCGHKPCTCKSSQYLPKRPNGKRGKRRRDTIK